MVIVGCLILVFWLGILPLGVGSIFTPKHCEHRDSPIFRMVSGNVLLWAVFQLLCVPCVILQESFGLVVSGYLVAGVFLFVVGLICCIRNPIVIRKGKLESGAEKLGWVIFVVLMVLQLICAVILAYADGDDAFYVAISEITDTSNTMYQLNPYSVGAVELDIRPGLAPFPVWIAFLARISGLHSAVVAHVIVGTYLIAMSYMTFFLVGKILFAQKKEYLPIFMNVMALLVLFGDYSSRTPENFMLARSRQGKGAIGTIIIPMLLFLLMIILGKIQEKRKVGFTTWFLLGSTVTAACLCTTLGTFLSCAMIGCIGVCALWVYRRVLPIVQMALCCIPALVFALLYFVLG